MSRDDFETGRTLVTPHIEIGVGRHIGTSLVYVNVDTFVPCLEFMENFRPDNDPRIPPKYLCSVYGVVGRSVSSRSGGCYLNIDEPPLSRTLMGYISRLDIKERLPGVYEFLESRTS